MARLAAPAPVAEVTPTSLMNQGDEIDDNIWVRRPRNRLQPGQSEAPEPMARVNRGAGPSTQPTGAGPGAVATSGADSDLQGLAALEPALPVSRVGGAARRQAGVDDDSGVAISLEDAGARGTPRPEASRSGSTSVEQAATASAARGARRSDAADSSAGRVADEGRPVWSIALMTFGGDDHRAVAEAACRQFQQQIPQLQGAFVRSTASGSVVMWGRYDGPRDPRARPALDELKQIVIGDSRPFQRAMLARLEQSGDERIGPWDLRQIRLQNPNVRVIYTLQVAAWSDLGSGTMTFPQIRRAAESYCQQLRAQGVDAWYYHDADQLTSIVTVGAFNSRAYDAQSTLYSDEVEAYRKRFPTSLLNGEELMIKGDPRRPDLAVPQPSRLVEVPR
ncbi:MAG: hypothetical protein KF724_00680 [Phycisphaeraceae bacterium]|nr:hypothetical protein [Phycisphaeraceae bacterium]